jgi:hypothetical protein
VLTGFAFVRSASPLRIHAGQGLCRATSSSTSAASRTSNSRDETARPGREAVARSPAFVVQYLLPRTPAELVIGSHQRPSRTRSDANARPAYALPATKVHPPRPTAEALTAASAAAANVLLPPAACRGRGAAVAVLTRAAAVPPLRCNRRDADVLPPAVAEVLPPLRCCHPAAAATTVLLASAAVEVQSLRRRRAVTCCPSPPCRRGRRGAADGIPLGCRRCGDGERTCVEVSRPIGACRPSWAARRQVRRRRFRSR